MADELPAFFKDGYPDRSQRGQNNLTEIKRDKINDFNYNITTKLLV